ncbi:MAG: Holliday junction branch migration DNA helicase RuvB [Patescibacteria group bacterium]|nr:Holliday junction branch migration DNA helicase RuvB [Patescibacteria group bacterium]
MEKIKNKLEKIFNPQKNKEDNFLDSSLRPKKLSEFIGQEKIKRNLEIFLKAAKKRNETVEHILFCGGPGLGKTTLAFIVAYELGAKIRVTSGSAIERAGDLAAILANLSEGEILFIDEIHRLNPLIEEVLYPSMEEYHLDLVVGRGPMAETLRIDLPPFTLIGATTRPSLLTPPLRDRFGVTYNLDFYEEKDLEKIVTRSAKILNLSLDQKAIQEIAKRARKTPRVANRLLKRVRDYAQVKEKEKIDLSLAKEALDLLEIDEMGLTPTDRKFLKIIIEKFQGGPTGIKTLAAALGEEEETLEEIYEPYLIQLGFLDRTPRGRIATQAAREYFGQIQQKLL